MTVFPSTSPTSEVADDAPGAVLGNGNGTFQAQQTFAVNSEPVSLTVADGWPSRRAGSSRVLF
jgi:hypothetical protein